MRAEQDKRTQSPLSLKACATPGATVKATLLSDGREIVSATQYVTVQPDLSPKIAMRRFFDIYRIRSRS